MTRRKAEKATRTFALRGIDPCGQIMLLCQVSWCAFPTACKEPISTVRSLTNATRVVVVRFVEAVDVAEAEVDHPRHVAGVRFLGGRPVGGIGGCPAQLRRPVTSARRAAILGAPAARVRLRSGWRLVWEHLVRDAGRLHGRPAGGSARRAPFARCAGRGKGRARIGMPPRTSSPCANWRQPVRKRSLSRRNTAPRQMAHGRTERRLRQKAAGGLDRFALRRTGTFGWPSFRPSARRWLSSITARGRSNNIDADEGMNYGGTGLNMAIAPDGWLQVVCLGVDGGVRRAQVSPTWICGE